MASSRRIGRQHPSLRRLRRLRRDGALRTAEDVLVAEGPRLAREALRAGLAIEVAVFAAKTDGPEGDPLRAELTEAATDCFEVERSVIDGLQDARSAREVVCLVRRPAWAPDDAFAGAAPLVVVADGIQDPGNLGALIRTADAAGAGGCLVVGDSADPFHPRAARASAGSIFRLPVVARPTAEALELVGRAGLQRVGSFPRGGRDYRRVDFRKPTALFFGREGSGLSPEVAGSVDVHAAIPMRDGVESLSVGAAAAVLLFEAASQRHRPPGEDPPAER